MAKRRMLQIKLMEADKFVDMPHSAKALYVQLCLDADDDGFVTSANGDIRHARATDNDLETLISLGYVYRFSSGTVLIRHWKVHNKIQKDRYTKTDCIQELGQVVVGKGDVYIMAAEAELDQNGSNVNHR